MIDAPAKPDNALARFATKIFDLTASLKFAVISIALLTFSLAVATVLESLYDTPTGQYYVYHSTWFHALLALFGINIFSVAMSRLPWKKRHIPFLLAHLGILMLLAGSWVTERYGIDGSLRITEGETSSSIDFEANALVLADKTTVHSIIIPWIPPSVKFYPLDVNAIPAGYSLKVDQYLTHADPVITFIPGDEKDPKTQPAIQILLVGGPMGISQELWLWGGDPNWAQIQAGPATLAIGKELPPTPGRPQLAILPDKDGKIAYRAISSAGVKVSGSFSASSIEGKVLEPGWKNVKLTFTKFIPHATVLTTYKSGRVQYGKDAPASAIHISAISKGADKTAETQVWLGLGDRAILHFGDQESEIAYYPRRTILPFSVKLDRFQIAHYEGTHDPSEYSSKVTVLDRNFEKSALISMNEPFSHAGFTLYQSSFEDGVPRPITSIFSVNRDPGRPWKYAGSLLIVLGFILLFADRYRRKKTQAPNAQKLEEVKP